MCICTYMYIYILCTNIHIYVCTMGIYALYTCILLLLYIYIYNGYMHYIYLYNTIMYTVYVHMHTVYMHILYGCRHALRPLTCVYVTMRLMRWSRDGWCVDGPHGAAVLFTLGQLTRTHSQRPQFTACHSSNRRKNGCTARQCMCMRGSVWVCCGWSVGVGMGGEWVWMGVEWGGGGWV